MGSRKALPDASCLSASALAVPTTQSSLFCIYRESGGLDSELLREVSHLVRCNVFNCVVLSF